MCHVLNKPHSSYFTLLCSIRRTVQIVDAHKIIDIFNYRMYIYGFEEYVKAQTSVKYLTIQ
jgi:hypothetical protein